MVFLCLAKEKKVDGWKRKYGWKGSYTVEAAVVLSLTFFVLSSLIICMFYLHDCAVAQGAACEAAAAGSNFIKTEERRQAADEVMDQIGGSRFMGSRNISSSVSVGEREVNAVWHGTYPVPGFAAKYLSHNMLPIQKSWRSKNPNPSDMIRKIRGIEELFIGGGD